LDRKYPLTDTCAVVLIGSASKVAPKIDSQIFPIDHHTKMKFMQALMDASPDFNPIEKAFSKLKAMLRKIGERTVNGLWDMIGRLVDIFKPNECANYFTSCGYDPD
jgi:hypothetical protein